MIDERKPRLTEAEAIVITRYILKGLKAMREINVVHRDLKPDNIMVNFPNQPPDLSID